MQIQWLCWSQIAELLFLSKRTLDFGDIQSRKRCLHVMAIALVISLLFASKCFAAGDQSRQMLDRVAHQATKYLAEGDWTQLRKISSAKIDFIEYVRAYPSQGKSGELRAPAMEYLKIPTEQYTVVNMSHYKVDMQRLNANDKAVLKHFQKGVKIAAEFPNHAWVSMDYNKRQEDGPGIGPAITGKEASSTIWRVELSQINGTWKVTTLIIENYPWW